jgi:CHASE3 domain sensor protein
MHWLAPPKMAVSLLLAALAALALVGINEAGFRQSTRALADIDEAQKGRGTVNQILQNMLDAETGQRGYLLTGEASYRQPYDTAIKEVDGNLATLRQLYAERPAELTQTGRTVEARAAQGRRNGHERAAAPGRQGRRLEVRHHDRCGAGGNGRHPRHRAPAGQGQQQDPAR